MTAITAKQKLKFIFRRWIQKIHLVTTLLFGVFIFVEILSGTLLLFMPEMKALLHPKLYHVTPGSTISLAEALKHVQAWNPAFRVESVSTPILTGNVYSVSSAESTVFIDPGTGQVNGFGNVSDILDWVFSLHYSFLLPGARPGGSEGPLSETWGRFSVGVIGALLVLMLLTGLVLWWPGIKRRLAAFRVRRNNSFAWNYSIHKLIGVIVAIPLLVITLVMLPYSFGDYSQPVLNFLHIPQMNAPRIMSSKNSAPKANSEPLSFDELVNKAIAVAPSSRLISIYTYENERKANPNLPVDATLTIGYDGALGTGSWGGNVSVQLDRYSGEVLNFQDARESPFLAQAIHGQLWMGIHMGTWGGWTTRILEFVISIAALYLPWTGIRQWWIKKKARKTRNKDFVV